MLLLVVRCLAFAVVRALMRARVNSGAQYVARYCIKTLGRSNAIKLRRELSPPVSGSS